MKLLESKQVVVGENTFYIFPFPAFKAANMSGKLVKIVGPMLGGLAAVAGKGEYSEKGVFDTDINKLGPVVTAAFNGLDGNVVESMLRDLLLNGNVTVDFEGKTQKLSEDISNELFCYDTQEMFMLAFEVLKVNYSGFFTKVLGQYGIQKETLGKVTSILTTANSTQASSAN